MSKRTVERIVAGTLAAGVALGIASCARAENASEDAFCIGSVPYKVQPGDTLNGVIDENVPTRGELTEGGASGRIATAMGQIGLYNFDGKRFVVHRYKQGTSAPTLTTGDIISLPQFCSDDQTEADLDQER